MNINACAVLLEIPELYIILFHHFFGVFIVCCGCWGLVMVKIPCIACESKVWYYWTLTDLTLVHGKKT